MIVITFVRSISLMAVAVAAVLGFGVREVAGFSGNDYPLDQDTVSSFSATHSGYPATDIFAKCGVGVLAPVSGLVAGLRRTDLWNKKTDNPWLRGGKFVSIVGLDGVRYYMSHLDTLVDDLKVGSAVQVGQRIGSVGRTGRAGGCHIHFGISPSCPNSEWWVRRGVVWPAIYLAAWRGGIEMNPAGSIQRWLQKNPDACESKDQMPWPSS